MNIRRTLGTSILGAGAAALIGLGAFAGAVQGAEPAPAFTEDVMNNPDVIEAGRELWQDQCRHCHGKSAYPGKAPKLKPRRYKPDFVYDRVTNGFRKMPAWKEVYSQEERMSVVAFIMSKKFSP